jgi:multidrug resistance efflux pump
MRRWLWLIALSLPLVGAGCWLTVSTLTPPGPDGVTPPRTGESNREQAVRLTCFGYVDGEHGVRALAPRQAGRVVAVKVREGDEVAAGAVLLQLDDAQARHALARAEAARQTAREELAQARESATRHQTRLKQQQAMAEAAAHRHAAARETLSLKRELARRGQVQQAEAAVAEEQARELEALEQAARAALKDLEAHDPQTEVRLAEARAKGAEAAELEARDALDECSLKAPEAGTVLRLLAGVGDVLGAQPREPVMQFVAAGPRVVRAEVAHEYASRVSAGQAVRVADEFDARQTWAGRVERVSDWYTRRRSLLFEPGQVNDVRTLECVIRLEAPAPGLRLGQRVRIEWGSAAR